MRGLRLIVDAAGFVAMLPVLYILVLVFFSACADAAVGPPAPPPWRCEEEAAAGCGGCYVVTCRRQRDARCRYVYVTGHSPSVVASLGEGLCP